MKTLVPLLVVLAVAAAPTALAQASWTVVAMEEGCGEPGPWCFDVTEGDATGLAGGTELAITLRNDGSVAHNLHVVDAADADDSHSDTSADAALAATEDVAPGASDDVALTVPAEEGTLYFWCDVPGHESIGMWFEVPVTAAAPDGDGNGDGGGDGDGNGGGDGANGGASTPVPWALAPLALAGVALLLRRR